ncbi:MAG: hypothetical protein GF381_02065 [Candidatus Pacebacteria bacterium]|nr:hypothetical protein [Candidatus Paceibacterota bacterium]
MTNLLTNFELDFWTFWGFFAQTFFFLRFVIQWYFSEKKGQIVVPHIFWIFSLIGSSMIMIYAYVRQDLVFLISGFLQIALFARNLFISANSEKKINRKQ